MFVIADPEDEQLLRAMDRSPPDAVRLLTRDSALIDRSAGRAMTPEAWIARSTQTADTPRPIGFIV